MKNIAILGATSHIAKGLIKKFSLESEYKVFAFCRNQDKMKNFMENENISQEIVIVLEFSQFNNHYYDVVINCIGAGTPKNFKELSESILRITEKYDNMVIDYLENSTNSLYINFSSGAIYNNYVSPIERGHFLTIETDMINSKLAYLISKLNSEAKHRELKHMNIVDLRLFSYFSRYVDLESDYLITDLINSVKNNKEFITNQGDLIRDYVSLDDLFQLILLCIEKQSINDYYDVYSAKEISKREIIDFFQNEFQLKVIIDEDMILNNLSGEKNIYYSKNHKAKEILGYEPKEKSIDCLVKSIKEILNGK